MKFIENIETLFFLNLILLKNIEIWVFLNKIYRKTSKAEYFQLKFFTKFLIDLFIIIVQPNAYSPLRSHFINRFVNVELIPVKVEKYS